MHRAEITTVDKMTWVEQLCERFNENVQQFDDIIDIGTSKWFADAIDIAGYMTGPVAVCAVNGMPHVIITKSVKVTDFSEFLSYIKDKLDRIYLYQILFKPNMPKHYSVDAVTFNRTNFEYPIIENSSGFWTIRFAEVQPTK